MKIFTLSFLTFTLALATGCTINATAKTPAPNFIAERKLDGAVSVDVRKVPQQTCSSHGGLKDFCIKQLRSAVSSGLRGMLDEYSTGDGSEYSASFKVIEFSHSPTSGGGENVGPSVGVAMKWQFVLEDGDGNKIVALAERTEGPQQLINVSAADDAVQALLSAVMERVASELNAKIPESSYSEEPEDETFDSLEDDSTPSI
jgi:hypothetical protein